MAHLIYNEIKKILKQERLLLIVIALLFTNRLYNKQLLFIGSGLKDYVHHFDGIKIEETLSTLQNIPPNEDLQYLNQEVMNQYNYSHNYSDKVKEMLSLSKNIINDSDSGSDSVALSKFITHKYQNREIDRFIFSEASMRYLDTNFSTLMLLVLLAFIGSGVYSKEKESGVLNMQTPTKNNRRLVISKSLALLVSIIGFSLIFYAQDWIMFNKRLILGDSSIALFALPGYASTPLNTSIFGFMLLRFSFNIIGIWLFTLFFALVSLLSKRTIKAVVINVVILFGINGLINLPRSYLNPYSLFSINHTFKDLNFELLFNKVVLTPYITLTISVLLIVIIGIITQKLYMSKRY